MLWKGSSFQSRNVFFNSKRHPYTGNLNSETLGDSKNALLHWGDVLVIQESIQAYSAAAAWLAHLQVYSTPLLIQMLRLPHASSAQAGCSPSNTMLGLNLFMEIGKSR